MKKFRSFIGADWSVVPQRRAAWALDTVSNSIQVHEESIHDLEHLLAWAEDLPSPTLIMIDAGLGVTEAMARANDWLLAHRNFAELLRHNGLSFDFLNPVQRVQEWTPHQPFIHLPAGQGSFSALKRKSEGTLYRSFESAMNAKPVYILSGIPGCVGGASRNVWTSLQGLMQTREIGLWPFDGDFNTCAENYDTVLCEAYPRLSLHLVLANRLPAILKSTRKRDEKWRMTKLARALNQEWFTSSSFEIDNIADAQDNDDSFDALMLVLAAARLFDLDLPTPSAPWEGHIFGQTLIA